jgi:hypothetical protein
MADVTLEQQVSHSLRSILSQIADGENFIGHPALRNLLPALDFFLPQILARVHPYWKTESLDGFHLAQAQKTANCRAELRGLCILISDQTLTPFHVRMQISPSEEKVNWMDCRLGKRGSGNGNMERIAWSQWRAHTHSFLQDSLKPVAWTYSATFGHETVD